MTDIERNEIATVIHYFLLDSSDEIRNAYKDRYGNLNGLRAYVYRELIEFWTNHEPYLDKEYVDYCWAKIDDHIVNLDDSWCFIRDGLKIAA